MRNRLKGKIIEKFGTIGAFVPVSGLSRYNLTQIIHGKKSPKLDEALKMAKLLDIPTSEIAFFFADEVA